LHAVKSEDYGKAHEIKQAIDNLKMTALKGREDPMPTPQHKIVPSIWKETENSGGKGKSFGAESNSSNYDNYINNKPVLPNRAASREKRRADRGRAQYEDHKVAPQIDNSKYSIRRPET
jgi:hypothetical protein